MGLSPKLTLHKDGSVEDLALSLVKVHRVLGQGTRRPSARARNVTRRALERYAAAKRLEYEDEEELSALVEDSVLGN